MGQKEIVRGGEFRNRVLVCLLLAGVTLAVFSPVIGHDFVNYDDSDYVSGNRHVQGGLTLANLKWAFTTGHASNWHPLTWLSHTLDWQLFGQRPGLHHLVSLLFHVANAVLLFLLLERMTGARWRSAFVAALFALHPLHVESVAWISERKDVLSAFFFFLTLLAYVEYVAPANVQRQGRNQSEIQSSVFKIQSSRFAPWVFYLAALLFFALGLMSKPMLVTVPFLLLLLDYWPLNRFQLAAPDLSVQSSKFKVQGSKFVLLLLEKLPYLALSAASCVATYFAQKQGGAVSTTISLSARFSNALVSYARYLGKLAWPVRLSVLYPHPGHWPGGAVAASACLLLLIFAVVLWLARRLPYLAVGWLWFFGALVPVIGLVQVGIQSMADRYTYLPAIGIFVIIAWGLTDVFFPRPGGSTALAAGSFASLFACALLTVRQVGYWRDSEKLFQHAVEVTPNNYLAFNNLGFFLSSKGKTAEAMENYQKSLAINPAYEDALNNVGYALAGQKKFAEAIPYYDAALRVRPGHVEVHNNLGNALSEVGKMDEAIKHYDFVLQHNPEHADAHNNLGIALAMQGKLDQAIPHFRDAIRFKPSYASAHSNLGNALAVQHRLEEAINEYSISLQLSPSDSQAHNNLGNALCEQGRLDDALSQYAEALRLNPNNPEAHFNSGVALARQGHREPALQHFRDALRLKPDYTEARRQIDLLERSK